ncbi:MAG: hypothetical protein ACREU1_08450 [Burkholderiales bacterium]
MKLTYEAILNDPSLLERIERQARRERAAAVHRLIVEPIKRVFADHSARPHLARQG